jgi:transposase-like protein
MSKHKQRSYELKKEIVEEVLKGRSYSSVSKEYNVLPGTIANWKRKYLKGTLNQDNRGRKPAEVTDLDILKKSYALLMEIRSKQQK